MEILSWNILSGGYKDYGSTESYPPRMEAISQAIKTINAETVCLIDTYRWTEVFTPDNLKTIFGYPSVLSVKLADERLIAKGHDNGVTVLSRTPGATMNSLRMATRNAIQVHTPNLDIFSVYLDDVNEDTRLLQMRTILGKVNPNLPTIILGDMNTVDQIDLEKTNLHMANLAAKFPGPMKSMEPSLNEMRRGEVTKMLGQEGYIDLGMGKGDTLPAKLFPLPTDGPIARFDYAFANKLVKLDSFRVLTEEPYASLSDHYPIWMRVTTL